MKSASLPVCLLAGLFAFPALATLKTGVALHGPLTWGRTTADKTGYLTPVYEGERYAVPSELLVKAKAAGFDFIRLSVDPGPLLALSGTQREALEGQIKSIVQGMRKQGLEVVVDFHPIGMVKAYSPAEIEQEGGRLFPAYTAMVGRIARLLKGETGVTIELMNEPQIGYNPTQIAHVQRMMETLFLAVRKEAPNMPVVISGGRGGSIDGLLALNPKPFIGKGEVYFSFHYYQPFVFTHQGVRNTNPKSRIWAYAAGLDYPVQAAKFGPFWQQAQARIRADAAASDKAAVLTTGQAQLREYFEKTGNANAIAADFTRVAVWADANKIPRGRILLGEFGATQQRKSGAGAPPAARARWLADIRKQAEARGFGWSMWVLAGDSAGGMALTSTTNPRTLDALTLQALGKRPVP